MTDGSDDDPPVGYGAPPLSTRFRKGVSGNPRGRPPGRKTSLPHDWLLGRMVTIRDGDRQSRVTAAEAFLLHLARKGLAGDGPATRALLDAIEQMRANNAVNAPVGIIFSTVYERGSGVNLAAWPLGIVAKLDRNRPTVRMMIEPWAVEAALARLAHRLTIEEQNVVLAATRRPQKVEWPKWWKVKR